MATNLVINGDFTGGTYVPTGDIFGARNQAPNGWIVTPGWSADFWSGSFCGSTCYTGIGNNVGEPLAGLSQTFADTPGAIYQVSFTLFFREVFVAGAFFDASVGGITLQIGPFPAVGSVVQNPVLLDHVIEQFYFTGTGSETLAFVGANSDSTSAITDVSVMAVPEPATWLLLLIGFALLAKAGRRGRSWSRGRDLLPSGSA